MQLYLSEKEAMTLRDVATEWCSIMSDGEETLGCVEEKLNNGLGAALYKLYKGRNGQKVYEEYARK